MPTSEAETTPGWVMPFVLEPATPASDLHGRLALLRRRLRRQAMLAGAAGGIAVVLAAVIGVAGLDVAIDLPAVIRALALLGLLLGSAWLVRRFLIQPWRATANEIQLALSVEKHFGDLNDAFASAVQFQNIHDVGDGSPSLRRAAIRHAIDRTIDRDFGELASPRAAQLAVIALAAATALATACGILFPITSTQALARLVDPYGDHAWPTRTRLEVAAPTAIARGEPFQLSVMVRGEIPDRAEFLFALENSPAVSTSYVLTSENDAANLPIHLEPSRLVRSFRYKLSAGDASTGWRSVAVRVPPQFVPTAGRPSPLVRLDYPKYTRLAPVQLPDGAGAIDAVLGTSAFVEAGVDRPVESAAIALRLNEPRLAAALIGHRFSAITNSWDEIVAEAVIHAVAQPAPMTLDEAKTHFASSFIPLLSGGYELTATDALGLVGRRPMEVRVLSDPAPVVTLTRPAASTDSLELAPDASFDLQAQVADDRYGIRDVFMEFRTRTGEEPRRRLLHDGAMVERELKRSLLAGLPIGPARPSRWLIDSRMRVEQFRHANGKPLVAGDVLSLAILADDFDDVSPDKQPGRSHEIELRIVSRERLASRAQAAQSELAAALRELQARQQAATAPAAEAERSRRATGTLPPEQVAELAKAESMQQQILERLGDEREGVRSAAEKLQRMLTDNPGANKTTAERIARGLERLSRDVLEPVGAMLSAAKAESKTVPPEERSRGMLPEAVRRQREAEMELGELAALAEAGRVTGALAAQASAISADQKQIEHDREAVASKVPPGVDAQRLSPAERGQLKALEDRQNELAKKAAELGQEISRQADAAAKSAAASRDAAALNAAREATRGDSATIQNNMEHAADSIAANRLGEAQQRQQAASQQLDRVRAALTERPAGDVDRLRREAAKAHDDVDRLTKAQEQLQDRTELAESLSEPAGRARQLQTLARDQEKLGEQAREQARTLSRQGQDAAARDLERAAQAMERARDQLERGQPAHGKQDDALNKLDDAADKTERAKTELDEQLQREQMLKLSGIVKGLSDRQSSLNAEADRIFLAAKSGWSRSLLRSLADLGRDEAALAHDVEKMAKDHLPSLKVLKYLADQSANAMKSVGAAIDESQTSGLTAESLETDRAAVAKSQSLAARRIKRLHLAVTPPSDEPGDREKAGERAANPQGEGGAARPPAGESTPAFAQLQVLRDLQAELNERTALFAKNRPDPAKWTPADRIEIDAMRRGQAELVELFIEAVPDDPPPNKK